MSCLAPGWTPLATCVLNIPTPGHPCRPKAKEALITFINYHVKGLVHWSCLMCPSDALGLTLLLGPGLRPQPRGRTDFMGPSPLRAQGLQLLLPTMDSPKKDEIHTTGHGADFWLAGKKLDKAINCPGELSPHRVIRGRQDPGGSQGDKCLLFYLPTDSLRQSNIPEAGEDICRAASSVLLASAHFPELMLHPEYLLQALLPREPGPRQVT